MNFVDYVVGIDEAGRGPLAGPVYVGAVLVPADFNFSVFNGLTDSKQMTEKRREAIFDQLENGIAGITFTKSFSTAATIDKEGINPSIQNAINRTLNRLEISTENTTVKLDGGLKASEKYKQETIIKGDGKEPVISLASVIAKVARDRKMCRLSEKFPRFNFAQHKGYSTRVHRETIKKLGFCKIHRRSFCRNTRSYL